MSLKAHLARTYPYPIRDSCDNLCQLVFSRCGGVIRYFESEAKTRLTFNFDKQDLIDFTKFSKVTMCRASEANS